MTLATLWKSIVWIWVAVAVPGVVAGAVLGGAFGCAGAVVGAFMLLFILAALDVRRQESLLRQELEGRWLLVCSRRGGWGTFIDNNVLTALPEGTEVVWFVPRRSSYFSKASRAHDLYRLLRGVERPSLVRFVAGQPEVHPLREKLVGLIHTTRQDEQTASLVRGILAEIVERA